MKVKYKVLMFPIYEKWFEQNSLNIKNACAIYAYKNSLVNFDTLVFIKIKKYTLITDLKKDIDEIFASFKSTTRNKIRNINKVENFTYKFNDISFTEFIDFYNLFAKEKTLLNMNQHRLTKYKDNLLFLSGYINGRLTNIQVYIFDEKTKVVRILYSISSIHYLDDLLLKNEIGLVNVYLHWIGIKYFKEKKYLFLDWGGFNNDKNNKSLAGVDRFKKSFRGKIVEIYDYYSIIFYFMQKIKELI